MLLYKDVESIFKKFNYSILPNQKERFKNGSTKLVFTSEKGYKGKISGNDLKQKKTGDVRWIYKGNPYTIYNIKNIWLKDNAPNYDILTKGKDFVNNSKKMKWQNKETKEIFYMSWANFQSGQREYSTKFERISKKQRNPNTKKEIEQILSIKFPTWSQVGEYHNLHSPILLKDNEGYYSQKNLNNLRKDKSVIRFSKSFPELSIKNMLNFLNRETEGVKLSNDQSFEGINKNYKFSCKYHGEFIANWGNFYYRKQGCPQCTCIQNSKGEKIISDFLEKNGVEYYSQKTFDNLLGVKKGKLKMDFYIPNFKGVKVCIEYNGKQHYEPIEWFGGEEGYKKQKNNDSLKKQFCLKNSIKLIEIPYYEKNIVKTLESHLIEISE